MKEMTVEIRGDKEFFRFLDKASDNIYEHVRDEAVDITNDVRNKILRGMRNTKKDMTKPRPRRFKTVSRETGRRKSIRTGALAKFHYPSLPGEYPAIDTGELVGSMAATESGKYEFRVGSIAVPHAWYTEDGTARMKPRPWLKPSFENIPIGDRIKAAFERGMNQ
jgi:hypothetical protein